MTTSGHSADTHGLPGCDPNLTNKKYMAAWAETQNPYGPQAAYGPISSLHSGMHKTSEKTSAHNYLSKCMSRAHRQASTEQVKNMSKPLVIKLMLQLQKPPTCLERKCGKRGLLITLCCWMRLNSVAGDAV